MRPPPVLPQPELHGLWKSQPRSTATGTLPAQLDHAANSLRSCGRTGPSTKLRCRHGLTRPELLPNSAKAGRHLLQTAGLPETGLLAFFFLTAGERAWCSDDGEPDCWAILHIPSTAESHLRDCPAPLEAKAHFNPIPLDSKVEWTAPGRASDCLGDIGITNPIADYTYAMGEATTQFGRSWRLVVRSCFWWTHRTSNRWNSGLYSVLEHLNRRLAGVKKSG